MREVRYRRIADDLRLRLEAGEFGAGRLLPSESALSNVYRVSRVTVRKALELLREDGLIDARQGFGWFAAADPLRQTLAELGTIEDQLAEMGVVSERRIVGFRFIAAPPRVCDTLGVASVLEVVRVNLADGQPFARVTVWCPAELAIRLSRADGEAATFYELLDVKIGRASQSISAVVAGPGDAELLAVPQASPMLRCERVTRDVDDNPFLLSEQVFPGHRTEFVVHLSRFEPWLGPSGFRLIE